MKAKEEKKNHGGARRDAGRPRQKDGSKRKLVGFVFGPTTIELLAAVAPYARSRFVEDLVIRELTGK